MADKTMNVKVLHVTKTTAEWAAESTVISKGLLCIEFAAGGKVLAKVGDGVNTFAGLSYVQDGTINIADYSTTEQVNTIVSDKIASLGNILTFKGVVASVDALPTSDQEVGDVWFVGSQTASTDDFTEYVWADGDWEYIGKVQTEVDLSGYVQTDTLDNIVYDFDIRIANLELDQHTHTNKTVLDSITAIDATLNAESTNPVQNKAVQGEFSNIYMIAGRHDDTLDQIQITDIPAIQGRLDTLEVDTHTHTNASVLNATTASFTTEQETKLASIETGANKTVVDDARSTESTNPVQNKVIDAALTALETKVGTLEGSNHTHDNKAVLDSITAIDTALSETSTNPVQNNVVQSAVTAISGRLDTLEGASHTHTNASVLNATTASFTTEQETKLAGIEEGANKTIVDDALSPTSTNPVQNKVVADNIDALASDISDLKTDTHTHTNKDVLDSITAVDETLSETSTNPVQNKVVNEAISGVDGRVAAIEADYVKSTDTLILNCTL